MSFVTNSSRHKILFRLGVAGIIIAIPLLAYGVFMLILYFTMETPKDNDVILPIIIKRSEMQGDYIRDERTPEEACNPLLPEVKNSNPDLNCRLTDSKRIDNDFLDECVDGASIAGCFACTFECQ